MKMNRSDFLVSLSAALAAGTGSAFAQSQDPSTGAALLGQGKYQWKVVPGWGVLDGGTPVKDCHGMIQTKGNGWGRQEWMKWMGNDRCRKLRANFLPQLPPIA